MANLGLPETEEELSAAMEAAEIQVDGDISKEVGSAETFATGEQPKKRGRPKLPRDEFGNIIRDGVVSPKSGSTSKRTSGKRYTAENRNERIAAFSTTITQFNPMLLDATCWMTGTPKQYCMGISSGPDGKPAIYVTDLGKQLMLPDNIIMMQAMGAARMQETPIGEKWSQVAEQYMPLGFAILAIGSTAMWFVGLMKMRPQIKEAVLAAQRQPQNVQQTPQTSDFVPPQDASSVNGSVEDIFAPLG